MLTAILSILGAIGGLAGLISLFKFILTKKSYQKQTQEEADSVAIKNLKDSFEILKQTLDKRSESQNKEIEELKLKIKILEDDMNKSKNELKLCVNEKLNLEENTEKMKSSFDVAELCDKVIVGDTCPILERYNKLLRK